MYCSQRHVLRHGWHFPSWPKVLSAHCSLAGLSGGTTGTAAAGAAAGKQAGSLQNCALPVRG